LVETVWQFAALSASMSHPKFRSARGVQPYFSRGLGRVNRVRDGTRARERRSIMKNARIGTTNRLGVAVSLGFSFVGLAFAGFNVAGCSSADSAEPASLDGEGATSEEIRSAECPILCGPGFQCVFVGDPPVPTCELVADRCATVLCPMGAMCENGDCVPVERVFCGGIASFPCPGAGQCVDDPTDDCDPDNGGADCGGQCACPGDKITARACEPGTHFDPSPRVCACVRDAAEPVLNR
jgi:hypothetical protein